MENKSNSANKHLNHNLSRVQEWQDLLAAIETLNLRREAHIERLARCEGALEERRKIVATETNISSPNIPVDSTDSETAELERTRDLTLRHLSVLKGLRRGITTLMLEQLKTSKESARTNKQEFRKTLLKMIASSTDIDCLLAARHSKQHRSIAPKVNQRRTRSMGAISGD